MAIYTAIVKRDGNGGYTASFPDFPVCAVAGPAIEYVIVKGREALLAHIERLVETGQTIGEPAAADMIPREDALLLAAVDVPDEIGVANIDLAIPVLSLARIDSFARRRGLSRASLFVEAVGRWALQETVPRERRGGVFDRPTLLDLGNPLELKVETVPAYVDPQPGPAIDENQGQESGDIQDKVDDIAAELVRLLEQPTVAR